MQCESFHIFVLTPVLIFIPFDIRVSTMASVGYKLSYSRITLIFVTLAAIAFAFLYSNFQEEILLAREKVLSDENSKVIETECGPINYASDGPEDGPPVLVVHGALGGYDQGLLFGQPLAKQGFRIIAPSRFGYLRTPIPETVSISAQADAHACLLDALEIKEQVAVFGTSAGSSSSLQFALRFPTRVRALVLLVPAMYLPAQEEIQKPALQRVFPPGVMLLGVFGVFNFDFSFLIFTKLARSIMIHLVLGTKRNIYNKASPVDKTHADKALNQMLPVSLRLDGLGTELSLGEEPIQNMELTKSPTLIISHKDDLYGTYEIAREAAERVPGARFIGYPDGGHMGIGYHDTMYNEITNFLQEHMVSEREDLYDLYDASIE
jgi:pimeloyl-ACP methyl ester carboxylesterase